MRTYYTRTRAHSYNQHWKVFSAKTHEATRSVIDFTQLEKLYHTREQAPRVLDAACGTGLLLKQLADLIPYAELYGVDASEDMLTQARLSRYRLSLPWHLYRLEKQLVCLMQPELLI